MKKVVLYHANCFDGMHSAAVALTALGNEAEYHAVNYDSPKMDLYNREVIFLDVVYKAPQMQQLIEQGNDITVVDHHADNLKGVEHLGLRIIDTAGESGASLSWQFFFNDAPMPLAVQHARDYDLWQFNMENTHAFVAQQGSLPIEIETYQKLHRLDDAEYQAFVSKGQSILIYKDSIVTSMASRAFPIRLMGFSGHAVNAPYELASEIGNRVVTDHGGDFALVWFQQEDGQAKISLRANQGSAPQKIAKALFGGGGHERASGAHCDTHKLLDILEAGRKVEQKAEKKSDGCECHP